MSFSCDRFYPKISVSMKYILFLYLDGDTELAHGVDVMMSQAKRIYILIIKVNKLFSFFSSRYFLKEIENMFSVFYFLITVWQIKDDEDEL